jgi:exopolyphosphatase/guanosine-5'-triphosphate,3'-diphosphate pyrophosphatase
VIDVGTNSIKLLVAEVSGRQVRPVLEESKQTRLGQGFYDTHRLQPGPMAGTAEAVARFADKARQRQARSIRVIATSAARDALNAAELIAAIERASGLKVEIISGDQEAEWGFGGAASNPALAREPLLLVDVGGGSTQMILGQGEETHCRQSFPLGTVRLLEKLPPSDPPKAEELAACRRWLKAFMEKEAQPKLEPAMRRETKRHEIHAPVRLVGAGGTATLLGCMEAGLTTLDRERLEATRLDRQRLQWHVERLWGLPLEARRKLPGLPPNRADVILTGAAIYEAVMWAFGFDELRVTTRGLRFAAVMSETQGRASV